MTSFFPTSNQHLLQALGITNVAQHPRIASQALPSAMSAKDKSSNLEIQNGKKIYYKGSGSSSSNSLPISSAASRQPSSSAGSGAGGSGGAGAGAGGGGGGGGGGAGTNSIIPSAAAMAAAAAVAAGMPGGAAAASLVFQSIGGVPGGGLPATAIVISQDRDASLARANRPIPSWCGIFYFEVTLISKGREG